LSEYTLTDRGTWLSSPDSVTSALTIFKAGSDDANDLLLNPAHVLLGKNTTDPTIAGAFLSWVVDSAGGQQVIANFEKNGQVLYSKAP
jgi:ABC-type tungstate transport system permease subunit